MSGFQIPGLGFAKPDEKLPPLEADPTTTTFPDTTTTTQQESHTHIDPSQPSITTAPESSLLPTQNADEASAQDSMVIDDPESPADLTSALEAALDGLEDQLQGPLILEAEQALGQLPPQPETLTTAQDLQGPEFEMDSSPYVSSSDVSSDSSDDDDSDAEGYELLGVEETARLLMEAEGGSDDEANQGKSGNSHLRTKNEMPEEVIPRPDVTITPDMQIEELGQVEHIVENMLLIKGYTPGEYQVLDTGSVICNAERTVLGAVADLIGKVQQPMYTVSFNSADEIRDFAIQVGTKIYYPVDHANFVFTEPLKNMKGSDASNLHDEEIGADEMEFSDDEKEAEYKRSLKQKKSKKNPNGNINTGTKDRGPSGQQLHPLSQEMTTELNYDDNNNNDEDGPYKPLSRPPGYGSGPVSQESDPARGSFHRNRGGRGDFRGRGKHPRSRGGRQQTSHSSQSQQGSPQPMSSTSAPPPIPPPGWNPQAAPPSMPFQWPPAPQGGGVPPPPPGWPGQGQQAGANTNPFANPVFFAALMSHMQGQQQQQQQQQQYPPSGHQ